MPSREIEALFAERIPLGRVGRHEELADLAAFLLSDGAGFITGDLIAIDGGERVWNAGEFNVLDRLPAEAWDRLEAARRGSGGSDSGDRDESGRDESSRDESGER